LIVFGLLLACLLCSVFARSAVRRWQSIARTSQGKQVSTVLFALQQAPVKCSLAFTGACSGVQGTPCRISFDTFGVKTEIALLLTAKVTKPSLRGQEFSIKRERF